MSPRMGNMISGLGKKSPNQTYSPVGNVCDGGGNADQWEEAGEVRRPGLHKEEANIKDPYLTPYTESPMH